MKEFGRYLRCKREENKLFLREVAASLGMDTPMLSKIERGVRPIKRSLLPELSMILKVEPDELLTRWLAEKVYETLKDEDLAAQVLKVAEEQIVYQAIQKKRK